MSRTSETVVRQPPPSLSRQKTYIVENADILDMDTKKAILCTVMMEVGKERAIRNTSNAVPPESETVPIVSENLATRELSINLDNIESAEVILHIYNSVYNRRAALDEPVTR